MSKLVKRNGPMWFVPNWSSMFSGVKLCSGSMMPALLMRMSICLTVELELSELAAWRTEDCDERSTIMDLVRTAGKVSLILMVTASILDWVREARIKRAGFCEAIERANASPRLNGLTPVINTVFPPISFENACATEVAVVVSPYSA